MFARSRHRICVGATSVLRRRPNDSRFSCEALFSLAAAGAAWRLPRLKNGSAGVTCKRHDAAPVLFGRGASAPGAERRLVSCEQQLGRVAQAYPTSVR